MLMLKNRVQSRRNSLIYDIAVFLFILIYSKLHEILIEVQKNI